MRRIAFILIVGWAAPAWAQAPAPSPGPSVPAVPGLPKGETLETRMGETDFRIKAGRWGREQDGHRWFRDLVDLYFGDSRIQADAVDTYEVPRADGSKGTRLVAEGNVVFVRGDDRLSGRRMTMDVDTGKGVFEEAVGFVTPGVFIQGERIERVDSDTYRATGGSFTSCSQPNPRWSFSASSARIEVDDKIVAKNVVAWVAMPPLINKVVHRVPLLYLPVFAYPIQEDQRSTGFLFPSFGTSDTRGFNIGTGFFWAMGRSVDQTFKFDRYSKAGNGLGHEFRYVRHGGSRGTFFSYFVQPKVAGADLDYEVRWNAVQMLPGRFRARLNANATSTQQFRENFQESLDLATNRRQYQTLDLTRDFGSVGLQLTANNSETYFSRRRREDTQVRRQLPTLRLSQSQMKIGRTGLLYSWELMGQRLGLGSKEEVLSYDRYDASQDLSRPFSVPFLSLTPRVQVRFQRWGARVDPETNLPTGPPIDRPLAEGDVELRGPKFYKVFDSPNVKHQVEPEVRFTYRTAVDEFDLIPRFDERDYLPGAQNLDYGIVQRLYVKRKGPAGKLATHELLNWSVRQTYYIKVSEGQNNYDPNYYTPVFGPGGIPSHKSPVFSRMRLRPTQQSDVTFDLYYDVNFRQVSSLSLRGGIRGGRGSLDGGWTRYYTPSGDILKKTADTVQGNLRFALLPNRLTLEGQASYDIFNTKLVYMTGRARYNVQCCGFVVEVVDRRYALIPDRTFRWAIELANIGAIGNLMGAEGDPRRRGGSVF